MDDKNDGETVTGKERVRLDVLLSLSFCLSLSLPSETAVPSPRPRANCLEGS